MRRPELSYQDLMNIEGVGPGVLNEQAAEQVEIQAKYAGYIERQADEIARQKRNEETKLPVPFDYQTIPSLSTEVWQKLNEIQPATIGQAMRISGVTPAAISILLVYLKKRGFYSAKQSYEHAS